MVNVIVSVACGLAVFAVVAAVAWRLCQPWLLPRQGRRVIISLYGDRDAGDLMGVLWERRGGWLLLRDASVLDVGARDPRPMDGEAMVEITRVRYVQVLP